MRRDPAPTRVCGASSSGSSRTLAQGTTAGCLPLAIHASLSLEWSQKRQEPRRPRAWRSSADRERLMCLVVERTLSAACTARLRALLSSSRSSRSSWMERWGPPTGREEAAGGHSAAGRAEGAEVGPGGT